jgi:type I restriction enzyme S subunit
VEWLGEVPVHWDVRKFRHSFRESPEKIDALIVGEMLSVSGYRGIEVKEYDDENRRRLEEDLIGYRIVRPGQLVVNTMWLNYAGLGVSDFEGHVSPAYRSYWISEGFDKRFVHHLMRSGLYVSGYTRLLTGIRPNSLQMGRDDLMEFPIINPPVEEQALIATFLDHETEKIDALIEEQRLLIELLKEKRQAVISHAVTKGLDSAAPLKDSGIEWLGKVPRHWQMIPLRWKLRCRSGESVPADDISEVGYSEKTIPIIGGNGVMGYADKGNTAHPILVIGRVGALCGNVHQIEPPAWVTDNALMLEVNLDAFDLTFLAESLRARNLNDMASKTAQPLITGAQVKDQRIPRPPIAEQIAITAYVHRETTNIDLLTSEAQHGIDLLQERRTALISAAVTGKIDVRGLATEDAA